MAGITGEQALGVALTNIKKVSSGFDHAERTGDNTYSLYFVDGSKLDMTIPLPKDGEKGEKGEDGVSIVGAEFDTDGKLVIELSDGTKLPPVDMPTAKVDVSKAEGNIIEQKADGMYAPKTDAYTKLESDAKYETKANASSTYATKVEMGAKADSTVTTAIANTIGELSDLSTTDKSSIVRAINSVFMSQMDSIAPDETFRKVVITTHGGREVVLDLGAIVQATTLDELKDVNVSGVTDGQLIKYDTATSKFVPMTLDLTQVLNDAKAYTDNAISGIAGGLTLEVVEVLPPLAEAQEGVIYLVPIEGSNQHTEYLLVNGAWEMIGTTEVDLSNVVSKSDVVADYTESPTDLAKVTSVGYIEQLKAILVQAIGGKVNTTDVVDNLDSVDGTVPLSAKQGNALKLAIGQHIEDKANPHEVTAEQVGAYDKATSDSTFRTVADSEKTKYLTRAEYNALISSGAIDNDTIYYVDEPAENVSAIIDDTVSTNKTTYSSEKIDRLLSDVIYQVANGEETVNIPRSFFANYRNIRGGYYKSSANEVMTQFQLVFYSASGGTDWYAKYGFERRYLTSNNNDVTCQVIFHYGGNGGSGSDQVAKVTSRMCSTDAQGVRTITSETDNYSLGTIFYLVGTPTS